jgi:mono/diheme cytochrome c family protein/small nuclear ribonucleoprotein (snRNP)-like protein
MPWRKPAPQIGIALLAATAALGQPPAVERGSQVYRPNCGFCHGVDARGAAAPDLARSLVVLEDTDGRALGAFLRSGRPDSGMPAFAGLSPEQSADLAAFLHTKIEESRARSPMDVNAIVVGNAASGAAYFNGAGKCRACHNPDTDFKGIGARYDPFVLQGRIINPRGGRGPIRPSTVRVTLPSGQTVSGRLVAVDDFSVTMIDDAGVRRSLSRDNEVPKVEITDPYQAHLDNLLKITDKQMHDLTAYLVTLK